MLVLDNDQFAEMMTRIANEVAQNIPKDADIAVVGIRKKGIYVAQRLAKMLAEKLGKEIECGSTDITLYRDDIHDPEKLLEITPTDIPFDVNDKYIILADDVLHTGRSCRAAIDSVIEYGRPASIKLAALIERGSREFPIQADFIGKRLDVNDDEIVEVLMKEINDIDRVSIKKKDQENS